MRLSAALWGLGSLVVAVAAQTSTTSIPPCALTCITSSLPQTKCSFTDLNCVCNDKKLESLVTTCVLSKCTRREGLTAKRISAEQCGFKPRHRGRKIVLVSFTCFSIGWSFFFSRIATRTIFKVGVLGFDDLFLMLAMICITASIVTLCKMKQYGLGRDVWYIDFDNFDKLLLWYWTGEYLYVWFTGFIKISLCYFFLRIFNTTGLKRFIYAAIIFQFVVMVTFSFVITFQCSPVDYAWKFWDGERHGKCININAVGWTIAAITIVLDVTVLALPIRELSRLKMRKIKKFYIMSMFCLGFVVTIISCIRLQSLVKFANTYNVTYDNASVVYWSTLEGIFGSVALCLPTLRAFLGRILPCWFAIQTSSTKQYSKQNSGSNHSGTAQGGTAAPAAGSGARSFLSRLSRRNDGSGSGSAGPSQLSKVASDFMSPKMGATATTHRSTATGWRRTVDDDLIDDDDDYDDLFELVEQSPTKIYHDSMA